MWMLPRQISKTRDITKLDFKDAMFWWNTWLFFSWTFRYKLLFWIQLKTLVSVIVFQNSFCTISLDMMMFWCLQSKVWLNMKTIKGFSGQYGFTRIYVSFTFQDLRNLLVKRQKILILFAIFCHVIGIWYCLRTR